MGTQYALMNNLSVGDNISIQNTNFKITGIYETCSMFVDGAIYVPLDKLQELSGTEKTAYIH